MNVYRCPENPIIEPKDVTPWQAGYEVIGAFNTGVTRLGDEIILLIRVAERPASSNPDIEYTAVYDVEKKQIAVKEFSKKDSLLDFSDPRMTITPEGKFLTSLSHFRIARSKDGIHFEIDDKPCMSPATAYETFGLEDPRISLIGDTYYITYVAVSPLGVTTALASTKDFGSIERHGIIFCPDNKDVVLFPEKIEGKYYAIHRPVTPLFEKYEMWIAESNDLKHWGNHHYLMGSAEGTFDCHRLGASAVPFRTDEGWLEVYHGVDDDNRYCLGAVLFDIKEPWKIIGRSDKPILAPETDYEIEGFFGNVVFNCGLLCEEGKLRIYYGVADTSIAYAEISLQEVMDSLK
ncbi:MAG: glycosidase [Planctomycetes bacterium]|nr:glycosidase [Planctomycetota bacterium]